MAVTDAYGDAATYRGIFNLNDATKDASILADLTAVSRYLDKRLGRFFTQDASVVARLFRGSDASPRRLHVADIATATGLIVKVDANADGTAETTLTITTDFELEPLDALFGSEPAPFTSIVLPVRSSWTAWPDIVEVTAKYGYPAIPAALARATYHITGVVRVESPRATRRIPEGMGAAIEASDYCASIIDELVAEYAKPAWVYS